MGTGSVTNRDLPLFSVRRRCLSPFSDAECPAPWKMGQAPRGCGYPRNTNGSLLGASPPLPLPTYSLSNNSSEISGLLESV